MVPQQVDLDGGIEMSKSTRRRAKMKRRKKNAIKGDCDVKVSTTTEA